MTKQDAVCSGILMYQGFKIGQKKTDRGYLPV
jgi:hypothetical protein